MANWVGDNRLQQYSQWDCCNFHTPAKSQIGWATTDYSNTASWMREFLHTGLVSNWMGNNRLQHYSQWDAGISTHRLSLKLDGQQPNTARASGMREFLTAA